MTSYDSEDSKRLDNISVLTMEQDTDITSHLTINTMILLGFDTDTYLLNYSGIAFDVRPLTPNTFNKMNEKMLLIVLHFLLLIVDKEEFAPSISNCFPFLDPKDKNAFKRAVHNSLVRVFEKFSNPSLTYKPSILTQACGAEVWLLLRFLSDIALDIILNSLRAQNGVSPTKRPSSAASGAVYHHPITPTASANNGHNFIFAASPTTPLSPLAAANGNGSASKELDKNKFPSWATAGYKNTLKSTNSMYLGPGGTISNNTTFDSAVTSITITSASSNASANAMRHEILYDIDEKISQVKVMIMHFTQEKLQWAEYLQELEVRLHNARKSIKDSEEKLTEYKANDHFKFLSEEGFYKRQRLLGRITTQKDLIQSFLDSPLLLTIHKHLEEEKAIQEAERLQSGGNPNHPNHNTTNADSTQSNVPRRRRVLSSEEMEAYKTSMRDAIGHLIKKIEEVCSVV